MPRNPRSPRGAPLFCLIAAVLAALPLSVSAGPAPTGSGPVGLAELIALGLKNDPALIASRGEISIAEARKRAARDWPDPQIRFRKTWGYNDVPQPYTETRQESYNQKVKRTDRTVTPGRDKTTINEKVRENSGKKSEITETRDLSFDPFASEEDLSAQFRLYLPHPAVRRAELVRAQREIELARNVAQAEEREVVLKIREIYEELQYLQTRITLLKNGTAAAERFATAQDELLAGGLITLDKLDYIDPDHLAAEGATLEFEAKRDQLAARVGLRNASRIRVTDKLISPTININHTHLEYLIRLALANRGELSQIRGKGMIAEAELKEFKAGLIPFPNYIQGEVGRDEQGGNRTGTSWGIQLAMSLPIFSLLGHEKEIYETAIASHYSQMGASREIVTAEVAAAYQNVKRSAAFRDRARSHSTAQAKRNTAFIEKLQGMEPHKLEETRYDISRGTINTDRRRLDAERGYNRALLQLEGAIGTSLEQVFISGGGAPPEALESAAPASSPPSSSASGSLQRVPLLSEREGAATASQSEPPTPRKRGFFGFFDRGYKKSNPSFTNRKKH
jgi:outer membrane protein TolC